MNYRETSYGGGGAFSQNDELSSYQSRTSVATREAIATRVLKAPAQDPHVLFHQRLYYYCESNRDGIFVRAAADFLKLGESARRLVWPPPRKGGASRNVWAPELQLIDGRCYIYFAADDGRNENHRMWVLAASSDDPSGPYELVGELETEGWAIDGTVLTDTAGAHFLVWSGWAGPRNGQQNLYISRMQSPLKLAGSRVLLATPDQSWERQGMPICEGPQILQRGGQTFIVYSASGSWTEDYCLGLLAHDGGDFMDPATWKKAGPVFSKNEHAWGVGHCGFVEAVDGSHWIMYHAKTSRRPGWNDREVRAQPFAWSTTGVPVFGEPQRVPARVAPSRIAIRPRRRVAMPRLSLAGFSA